MFFKLRVWNPLVWNHGTRWNEWETCLKHYVENAHQKVRHLKTGSRGTPGHPALAISVCDFCWCIWWLLNGAAPLQTLYLASALVACLDELHDTKGFLGDALQPRCGVRVWFLNMDTNGARFHALCDFVEFDSCAGNSCHASTDHEVCMIPSNLNLFPTFPNRRWKTSSWYLEISLSIPFPRDSTPRGQCTFAWRKRLPLCWNLAACPLPRSRRLCAQWALKHQRKAPKHQRKSNPFQATSWVEAVNGYKRTNGEEVKFESHSQAIVGLKISKLD